MSLRQNLLHLRHSRKAEGDLSRLGNAEAATCRNSRPSRLHTQSVIWCGLGPDSAYGFTATLATWMVGGSVCFLRTPDRAYEDLIQCNVNVIIASPAALNSVLQSLS